MDQEHKCIKHAEIRPENRSIGRVRHALIDEVGSRSFSEFVRLEIATYGSDRGFYLFHICADGKVADTWHETLEDAIHQAEFEFEIRPDEWQDSPR